MNAGLSGLAARRYRITLMAEEKTQGAGGRFVTTSPIIADVWASVEESNGALVERAVHEFLPTQASFTTRYKAAFLHARRIRWQGGTYRVSGQQANRAGSTPSLTFEASLMEGNQS